MKSCIYQGNVSHTRLKPKRHHFEYSLFMMYLDLDEVSTVLDRYIFWSANRPNLAWFRRSDHTGSTKQPLTTTIRSLIKEKLGQEHTGPIRLLTHCRYFGYCFNPVSFYYCWDETDTQIEYIVAEVSNTPWKEMYCYVLDNRVDNHALNNAAHLFEKNFHVSPFMDLSQDYEWFLPQPKEKLIVRMNSYESGKHIFNASMTLKRKPITKKNMFIILCSFPFITLKVIAAIHWQALQLWLKKIPFYSHPKHLNKEIDT